jgi:hypothetical protein
MRPEAASTGPRFSEIGQHLPFARFNMGPLHHLSVLVKPLGVKCRERHWCGISQQVG